MPTSSRLSAPVSATAVACLTAALLSPASALAADSSAARGDEPQLKPPARMSAVGGPLLARPGTQVRPGEGAPELPEEITSRSWIVADAGSGEVLAAHNAHWKLPPASTLKMLFADTVMPKLPRTKKYKVKPSDLQGIGEGSSLVGIKEGETYTVHDLWRGVFLRSGNDAVHVLAAMNGGVPATVEEMNRRAEELNASDTHVVSPDGYDRKGQVSSAYDLTLFARAGMRNADFREYASTAYAKFPGEAHKAGDAEDGKGGNKRDYFGIQSTNRLLTGAPGIDPYPGIKGVKNGTTTKAGSTFTGYAERDGRKLLVTAMNPTEEGILPVFEETAQLLDWGFEAAGKVKPVGHLLEPGEQNTSGGPAEGTRGADPGGQNPRHAAAGETSGGVGTALGVTGGVLILLAVAAYGVHRRRPLTGPGKRRLPRD